MKILLLLFLSTICIACGSAAPSATSTAQTSSAAEAPKLISSLTPTYKDHIAQGASVEIKYKPLRKLDSVIITFNGERLAPDQYTVTAPMTVGKVAFRVEAWADGKSQALPGQFIVVAAKAPNQLRAKIVRTHPHQTDGYTQGLIFRDGMLYESTGEYGHSSLRKVEIATGRPTTNIPLDKRYFGEGIEELNGKIYQLTWREGVVLVYDATTFEPVEQLAISGEGWGVATDGKTLFVSDGTTRITEYDPQKMTKIRSFEVCDNQTEVNYINELEWIDGKIWANIYTTNLIAIINPVTGVVESYIDCSELERKIGNQASADVLNGIAYDPKSRRIWVTGKKWDTLFEISAF